MIRKIVFPLMAMLFIAVIVLNSCKKDKFSEEDALANQLALSSYNDSLEQIRDSLKRYGGSIHYTVNVVSAGDAGFLKSVDAASGLDGVEVTISQLGVTQVRSTVNGQALFNDLRIGHVNVSVHFADYTDVDYIADLTPLPYLGDTLIQNWYNEYRAVATIVPVFATTGASLSTIKGRVTYENNLVNNAPENLAGTDVIGVIDVDDPSFAANFLAKPIGFGAGGITKIAYSSLVSRNTTDANGDYTLTVPTAADGLAIKILVSDVVEDQTLLLNKKWGENAYQNSALYGQQTVRTIFSSEMDGVTQSPSTIPQVAAAYVTFGAPTGNANVLPSVAAAAIAIISPSGIETTTIDSNGTGYTQAPMATVTTNGFGSGAVVTPVVAGGLVTSFTINNAGSGYLLDDVTDINILHHGDAGAPLKAAATARMGFGITDYNTISTGAGYTSSNISVTILSGAGSGATAQAVTNGYVSELTLTDDGTNYYTQAPTVVFTGGGGHDAQATANMTASNPIASILVPTGSPYFDASNPPTTVFIQGNGSGAAATLTMSTNGTILNIATTSGGYYDPDFTPSVTITGNAGSFGAIADAWVNPFDSSIVINLIDGGYGYTNATVTIAQSPYGAINSASAIATIGVQVATINVTNGGSGYVFGGTGVRVGPLSATYGTATDIGIGNGDIFYKMYVESLTLNTGGFDFTSTPTVSFVTANGIGSGAAATASIEYTVEDIIVLTEGSGYDNDHPVVVQISAPPTGGTVASYSAVLGNGKLVEMILNDGGSGYTAVPHVVLDGGGYNSEAEVTAIVSGGKVTGFTITNAGMGYTIDPTVDIRTYFTPASASATAYPTAGQILYVNVMNPGEGYTVAPTVEFEIPNGTGSGSGAAATAALDGSGRVSSITLTNPGSGYYEVPTVKLVVPNYNLTALGRTIVSPDGHITSVQLVDAQGNDLAPGVGSGQGYITVPGVTFTEAVSGKMLTQATGIAEILNGQVVGVTMTNQGSGYLGRNAYTTFGYNAADAAGKPVSFYAPSMNAAATAANHGFMVEAGKTYVIDVDMGTGKRTVED